MQAILLLMLASAVRAYTSSRGVSSRARWLSSATSSHEETENEEQQWDPWNNPRVAERVQKRRRNNKSRFRQHVNPLARQYQQPTRLSDCWPHDVFHDVSKPLHLDIGCGKGGFLLDLASHETDGEYNYLGLEIRPGVAQYAQSRIERHNLEGKVAFVGCNANVDLERLLQRYHDETAPKDGRLTRVSIQFPDPHFKSQHQKRRVVNRSLIETLARYMPTDGVVFLQSDVQGVLDDMRARFRESSDYFRDSLDSVDYYHEENTTGVPTEREVSVLERGLPVHRSIFYRKEQNVVS